MRSDQNQRQEESSKLVYDCLFLSYFFYTSGLKTCRLPCGTKFWRGFISAVSCIERELIFSIIKDWLLLPVLIFFDFREVTCN